MILQNQILPKRRDDWQSIHSFVWLTNQYFWHVKGSDWAEFTKEYTYFSMYYMIFYQALIKRVNLQAHTWWHIILWLFLGKQHAKSWQYSKPCHILPLFACSTGERIFLPYLYFKHILSSFTIFETLHSFYLQCFVRFPPFSMSSLNCIPIILDLATSSFIKSLFATS